MAIPVILPRQGQSVESCIITKWFKKKGEAVQAGEILFSYETDKASFDEEAKVSGIVLDIFFEEGDDVPCLMNVCAIGEKGESVDEFRPGGGAGNAVVEEVRDGALSQEQAQKENGMAFEVSGTYDGGEIRISPRARNLAGKTGVDYRNASPSGPYGRIIEKDIISLKESGSSITPAARDEYFSKETDRPATGSGMGGRITTEDLKVRGGTASGQQADGTKQLPYDEVKLTNIRKVIAKAMHNSIASTAQLTLNTSFDASCILEFRQKIKESREYLGIENITLNDIILYAVSRTLLKHKDLNAHFLDDRMLYFRNVNLGVAVDTDRGLMVPTLFNADLMTLNDISAEVKKLVKGCQSGSINPDLLKNGSFTVTNLGTLDIESFTPVLNPPQTGILGVNTIIQRAKEVNGEIVFYPAMGLSLTFDHRALDGAPAAKFLQDLKKNLENFSVLLVK